MTLTEFLSLSDASLAKLAKAAGMSRQSMNAIVTGKSCPSIATAQRISTATGGVVSLEEIAKAFKGKGRVASS